MASRFVHRTRRNHAIEHATIHFLSRRHPGRHFAGRSDAAGFVLFGDIEASEVEDAVRQALTGLRDNPALAVHPFCGTNLVVAGVVSGAAALVAMSTARGRSRGNPAALLPRLLLAGLAAAVASQPLGPLAQRHVTTTADTATARLGSVEPRSARGRRYFRVGIVDAPA